MQPRNFWNMAAVEDAVKKETQLSAMLKDLYTILSNGFTFTDNMRGGIITVDFVAANTLTTIRHGLAFAPSYYFPIQKGVAMDIYGLSDSFNKTNIYLSSTAVGQAVLLVF